MMKTLRRENRMGLILSPEECLLALLLNVGFVGQPGQNLLLGGGVRVQEFRFCCLEPEKNPQELQTSQTRTIVRLLQKTFFY